MQQIKLIGVPFHYGQDHTGVRHAPHALRKLGLIDRMERLSPVIDLGDLDFSLCGSDEAISFIKRERQSSMANELISQCIEREDLDQSFLLSVGGDHGMGLGTIHGLLKSRPDMIVVWADAHGDINTPETSPSGNFHGMPLAFLLGLARDRQAFAWMRRNLSPHKLILMGPRDLDAGERKIIQDLSIQYYSSREMNDLGVERILRRALEKADPEGKCPIHLSFDVDLFDASDVHSTGTRVEAGPHFEEVFLLGKILGETGRFKSMDLVEVNPEIGDEDEVTETLFLALEFLDSCLGASFKKKIPSLPFYSYSLSQFQRDTRPV